MDKTDKRIPVTLLTGFLGAGKTTLLNHLIRDPEAGRIAVVMNEFGDVGLDHDLIETSTEETVLLDSGCLCCSIRGDLATTLADLSDRRAQGELSFDRLVIETTGIADPGPVLHTLVMSDLIAPHYRMDGVVTLADAATGPQTLDQQFEAVHQIAVADLIVLTKSDLVSSEDLSAFEKRLTGLNSGAQLLVSDHGQVAVKALFGLSALRPDISEEEVANWLGDAHPGHAHDHAHDLHHAHGSGQTHSHGGSSDCDHDHSHAAHHHHDDRIQSASIEVQEPIPFEVFDFWLDTLIALKGPNVLRIKGIVHVADTDFPFAFHGVQHIFDTPVPLKSWTGSDTTSRVIVIARDMSKQELQASLSVLRMKLKEVDRPKEPSALHHIEVNT